MTSLRVDVMATTDNSFTQPSAYTRVTQAMEDVSDDDLRHNTRTHLSDGSCRCSDWLPAAVSVQ